VGAETLIFIGCQEDGLMTLATFLRPQVNTGVRARGEQYLREKRVRDLVGDAWKASANVVGTDQYHVTLRRDDDAMLVYCDCEYFADRLDTCKHVWATLLEADRRGYLRGDGTNNGIFIDLDMNDEAASPNGHAPVARQGRPSRRKSRRGKKDQKPAPAWRKDLTDLEKRVNRPQNSNQQGTWGTRQLVYILETWFPKDADNLPMSIGVRERRRNGEWSPPRMQSLGHDLLLQLPDPVDREAGACLLGARKEMDYGYYTSRNESRYRVGKELAEVLLPRVCATGRCFARKVDRGDLTVLTWDEGAPLSFTLRVEAIDKGKQFRVSGFLEHPGESLPLSSASLISAGLVVLENRIGRIGNIGDGAWLDFFRTHPELTVPAKQLEEWQRRFYALRHPPAVIWPEGHRIETIQAVPSPRLTIKPDRQWDGERIWGELSFDYQGNIALYTDLGELFVPEKNLLVHRDREKEGAAAEFLQEKGFKWSSNYGEEPHFEVNVRAVPALVRTLTSEGWHVEAEGKLYRQPGKFDFEIKTNIDWFELNGNVQFGDQSVSLPQLLAALRKGENTIVLGDGSFGMLPEEWLKKHGFLIGLGELKNETIRFQKHQAGFLDALLAAQPEARFDAGFKKVREELKHFEGIKAAEPPKSFVGTLRKYQKEGLGWLHFLNRFGFGGCLADDMGLGKTVQVLAMLAERKEMKKSPGPSLIVLPRSLVFNWIQEAAKFAPALKLLDHTGAGRLKPGEHFQDYDLILTTYGTLRRDAAEFTDVTFDYCILDEAQAIKNAKTESAKAARVIQANHRLALTGTPVENHLGELWSIFEFLNPGMLGHSTLFTASTRKPDDETRIVLARALKPFLLRRTKGQVATDLPEKNEQTLFADMDTDQRKLYDELREYYRVSLLSKIEKDGLAKSKIQVLEALLRLRQMACHPGLINEKYAGESSAKLDMLLPRLQEVWEEGHKALVFSQFTTFLGLLRKQLDKDGITYEYLDGKTRNRAEKVERFQSDPDCKLFLISLKAGGVGLNLTSAEYVFLLDPWWNPAVEAQAIDRTHRIGQTKPVFAYRLIARDTVEEKVLELQNTKRNLADAILNADNKLMRDLGKEDLELLLS